MPLRLLVQHLAHIILPTGWGWAEALAETVESHVARGGGSEEGRGRKVEGGRIECR